ncbi:MAG: hypothetical protein E6G90_17055 [Alphaproteobacteria bacterium]|nr:MAG: hypothetical protein E6G90_17055 [Alphaproteobacteria bacterium]
MYRYSASFRYQAGSSTKRRRVVAKVEWHPGELFPQVGLIVTNLAQPVKRLVALYNHRGICEQYIKEGTSAVKWPILRRQRRPPPAPRAGLQSRQFHADAGDAKDGGTVVADQLAREADQDRRQGREPRPLRDLSDGRGRGAATDAPGTPDVDRATAGATRTSVIER